MQNNVVEELAKIVSEMTEIVKETERIQTLNSISQEERENLKRGTAALRELSKKIVDLSKLDLEDGLIKERLRQVGESLEILVQNREKIDSQRNLSSKYFYNEVTGKKEESRVIEGHEEEKYGERGELEANTELVKSLSSELESYVRKNLNERLAKTIQNRSQTLPEEEEKRQLENIEKELSELKSKREDILAKGRRKNELDAKLIELCKLIDPNMTERMKIAVQFEDYDDIIRQIINILEKKIQNMFEEYEMEKKMIEKGMKTLTPEQLKQFEQKRSEMGEAKRKIIEARNSLEELKKLKEETKEERIEEIKNREKALKEKRDNIVFERKIRPLRLEIQRGIEELPPELKRELIAKANKGGLNIEASVQGQAIEQRGIEFYNEQLKNLEESLGRIERRIEATSKIYDEDIKRDLNNGEKVKRITEEKLEAIKGLQAEKTRLEEQIKNLRRMISKYNTISKRIDDLILFIQNKEEVLNSNDDLSETAGRIRSMKEPLPEKKENPAVANPQVKVNPSNGTDSTKGQPGENSEFKAPISTGDGKGKEATGTSQENNGNKEKSDFQPLAVINDPEKKQEEVKGKRKSKLSDKLKKIIKIGIGILAGALVIIGIGKAAKKDTNPEPSKNSVKILSNSETETETEIPETETEEATEAETASQRIKIVSTPETEVEETETEEETESKIKMPKTITMNLSASDLQDVIEGGMYASEVADDEYTVANGEGKGITEANVQWWTDEPTTFTYDERSGEYLATQGGIPMKWFSKGSLGKTIGRHFGSQQQSPNIASNGASYTRTR